MNDQSPLRGVGAAALCPVCQEQFVPTPQQLYCTKLCRNTAYRHRKQLALARPAVRVPAARPRGPITVYECDGCGARALGSQRCDECGTFMRRVGFGGLCPHCEEPVSLADLLDKEVMSTGIRQPQNHRSTGEFR